MSGHQYRWLAGGYDMEILDVASMVVTWWIVGGLCSDLYHSLGH